MKRTVFAILIFVVILVAGILEQVWLGRLFRDLGHQSEEILAAIDREDMTEALTRSVQLRDWWEARKHLLEAIVSHNETKEVTLRIAELQGYIAIGDQKSSYATAAILAEMATNLPHLLGFSWDTVC